MRRCRKDSTRTGHHIRRLSPEERARLVRLQKKRERRRLKKLEKLRRRRRDRLKRREADPPWGPVVAPYIQYAGVIQQKSASSRVRFPKVFSFFENPEAALGTLNELALAIRGHASIYIDQGDCATVDLGAMSVAAALVTDAKRSQHTLIRGNWPRSPHVSQAVDAAGIIRVAMPSKAMPPGFFVFPLTRGSSQRESAYTDPKSRVTTRLISHFDDCLARFDVRLTDPAKKRLADLVSEALGNAEEHTQRRDWWVAAYLHESAAKQYGDFHITIFNLGESIGDTMKDLESDNPSRDELQRIITAQSGKWYKRGVDQDLLRTVFALQEHVSSLRGASQPDRGQGSAEMISFFYDLGTPKGGDVPRRMAIISGSTFILFDGTYRLKGGKEGRRIAFNRENDLLRPPDSNYVRKLNRHFPGTVITMEFPLHKQYLLSLTGEHRANDES